MEKSARILTVILLFFGMAHAGAEGFRVRSMTPITVDATVPEPQTVEIGYNDAIGVVFAQNPAYIKAIEIEVKIPKSMLEYQNSMAWGLYRKVQPLPNAKKIDYQAEEISLQSLPSRLTFVLQIPLRKDHGLKTSPYATVLQSIQDPSKGPLLFRLLPIMKGLPEDIEAIGFTVRIKPILADEGAFRLGIEYPQGEQKPVTVYIDDVPVQNPKATQILATGTHHLSVVSDDYRNELRVFTVEQARMTELSVRMQDTAPRLYLLAPENARVYLDDVELANAKDGMVIEPGDHTVRFTIGDYEVTRPLTIEKGKDYTVSMLIDVNITVSP